MQEQFRRAALLSSVAACVAGVPLLVACSCGTDIPVATDSGSSDDAPLDAAPLRDAGPDAFCSWIGADGAMVQCPPTGMFNCDGYKGNSCNKCICLDPTTNSYQCTQLVCGNDL